MVISVNLGITEADWVVLRVLTEASSLSVNTVITDSSNSTYDVINRMLWAWVAMWSKIAFYALLTSPSNKVIGACAKILLIILISSCFG